MCSGRAFVFQESTCLRQARPKMCGSMPSEAKACCHTSRPRAWHRHLDPPSPHAQEVVAAKSSSVRRSSTTQLFWPVFHGHIAPLQAPGFLPTRLSRHRRRLAASPSRGFFRLAARGRMQTFTAPRAPPAGEIVRLVNICTRDLYAFVSETLTLSSLG